MKSFLPKLSVLIIILQTTLFAQAYDVDTVIYGLPKAVSFSAMGNNKFILTIKDSTVRVYSNTGTYLKTFWNFSDSLYIAGQESGVLGVCTDPDFNTNHYVYVYYTHLNPASIRIIRFTENNNSGTNPFIIFNHQQSQSGTHYGGNMHFGPDDKLYISVGTGGTNSDAQLRTTPRGKILRINRDGTAPLNNPFYDDGNPLTGNDDRIWALGMRNSFDFCFSPFNDSLYATENGQSDDELNFIRKGKNYGWPLCEGYCSPYIDSLKQPMFVARTYVPTGIIIYNGSAFPGLSGKIIFGSYGFQSLYIASLNASLDSVTSAVPWAITGRVTSLMAGSDGVIYALKFGFSNDGALLRLRPFVNGIGNQNEISSEYILSQNFPNPFNPVTSIKYEIPKTGFVTLKIFNELGMELISLVNETKQQGSYEVTWDASNYPSGVYFYELNAGDPTSPKLVTDRKKMVLIK